MNNSQLQIHHTVISTMASGRRDDVWHWINSDVSLYSSEKLHNILGLCGVARTQDDINALQRVRSELERRSRQLG